MKTADLLKKINKVLKENDPLIDFISKIILTIITISIAIIANNIASKQAKLEEINIIPNISIEKEATKYHTNLIKVYNNGGPVYNLDSKALSFINIISLTDDRFVKVPIMEYRKTETGNQTGLLLEYQEYIHNNSEELEDYINQRFSEDGLPNKVSVSTITYIKISYSDKLNNITSKYFLDNTLISTETAKKIEKIYATIETSRMRQSEFEEIYQYYLEETKNNNQA